ncbi:MAG TPA: AAA family ATPase [Candidatus Limnocylindria bacterium]|nr:AAA family ATPase [Candidatus Limnocylindria bacterium]
MNVLIGANGSGKSNFLQFFRLLQNMMDFHKGLQNHVREKGGSDSFLFRGSKISQEFSAGLWLKDAVYRTTLRAAADKSMFLAREEILVLAPKGTHQEDLLISILNREGQTESKLRHNTELTQLEKTIATTVKSWGFYHFHDTSANAGIMGPCNALDSHRLRSDAANISGFLRKIRDRHSSHYARIVETIRLAAPFFGEFVLDEVAPGQTQLLWQERYADPIFYPHQLSDGTLRFICLVTLLLQPTPPSTLLIDEPELGLHPYAIELLAGLLREASTRCQLIVSTQSMQLVNELDPEDLIVVDRKDGETTFSRHNSEELATWLEEYSLGELWNKNVLGGRPQA